MKITLDENTVIVFFFNCSSLYSPCVLCAVGSDVLHKQYSSLVTRLEAHTVAVHMYQRNALTMKELQSIQSQRDRPVKAAEKLLKIITVQPDAVYLCFLDVLKRTGQQHIYQTLVEGGYKGKCSDVCVVDSLNSLQLCGELY